MANPFRNPLIRYGLSLLSATALAVIAFTVLEGTMRWFVLALAGLEILVTPHILKRAG